MQNTEQATTSSDTFGEDFSPGELAFIGSRGEDASGLASDGSAAPQASPAGGALNAEGTETTPDAPAAPDAASQPGDGEDEELVITIDQQGRAKDAKTGKFVPHAALHKERVRRQESEARERENSHKLARADERLAVLNDILLKAQEPDPAQTQKAASVFDEAPIDPKVDILGAFEQQQRMNAALVNMVKETKSKSEQDTQAIRAQQTEQGIIDVYKNDAIRFNTENPAFAEGYRYLINQRHKELEAQGMGDEKTRLRQIAQEERGLVETAIRAGKSPAQMLFTVATSRGFAPAARTNGATPPAAPQNSGASKLAQIAKGQQASASLSGSGGPGAEGLTIDALIDMPEDELAKVATRLGKAGMRRLLDG